MRHQEHKIRINGALEVELTLARVPLWGDQLVNRISSSRFCRVTLVRDRPHIYEVRFDSSAPSELTVVHDTSVPAKRVLDEIGLIFGLDRDPQDFYEFARQEPPLRLASEHLRGMRLSIAPNGFEMLASAICAQQVNRRFAEEVRSAFVRRFGVRYLEGNAYAFPAPSTIADAGELDFQGLRLSARKIRYLRSVAAAFCDGWFDVASLRQCDRERAIDHLTQVPGIGKWTAEWYLLRVVGRPDISPISDLILRNALNAFYGDRTHDSIVAGWNDHASVATEYLIAAYKRNLGAGANQ